MKPTPTHYPSGEYLLLFDPLDGSSNIDVNISVGTIFSVLRCPQGQDGKPVVPDEKCFLQPGRDQVAAGFAVYGPTTQLVITVGDGAFGFTLDRETYTFVLTNDKIRIPEDTAEFAINASNMRRWEAPVKRYIDECLAGKDGPRGKDFNMRWVASMVADVYRVLSRGGIFMYPRDSKNKDGRLRLMYEANPMAFIVEQAGGAATDGTTRILDIQPQKLHQRIAVVLGSKNEVERVPRTIAERRGSGRKHTLHGVMPKLLAEVENKTGGNEMMNVGYNGLWGLLVLAGDIWAIINILQSSASNEKKLIWVIAVVLLPVLGLILWFFLGPRNGRT